MGNGSNSGSSGNSTTGTNIYLAGLNGINWADDNYSGTANKMTKENGDVYTFTFEAETTDPFPYGFKFTTENGWQEQYQAYNVKSSYITTEFKFLELGISGSVFFATKAEVEATDKYGDRISDDATKFKLNQSFVIGNKYTITFDKANMKVKITSTNVSSPNIYITNISINSTSHKTSYKVGESLDVSGLTIEVTRDDGTTKTSNVTSSMISGFDSSIVGTQTLTITYGGCTTTFDVEVVANVSLTGIEIVSEPDKTSYSEGEDLDLEGLIVRACYSDYSTSIVNVTSDMVSGFDSSIVGTQTLTITYGGCTTTFDVEVHEIETETVEATASNVYDKVSGLSSGYYLLKLSGEITSSTIADITSAMEYTSAKINLDLSDTTGLTSTGSGTSGSRAFWYCDNLISITLPAGLTSIGNDAFTGCSNLINVVIPESVTEIGHDAFKSCSKLINAEIPEGVTTINEQTFAYCSSLTSVTIPASVTYIDYSAFEDCNSLTTVNYRGTQEQWEQISIGSDNTYLTNATINYNYTGE